MVGTRQPMRTATRVVLTFLGVLVLALASLFFIHFVGYQFVLLVVVPGLVLIIYALPGHGERPPVASGRCWRCGHPFEVTAGTGPRRCAACGVEEAPGSKI